MVATVVLDDAQWLQKAKRAIRQQEKRQSPYYWEAVVFVGPQ
jgi:CHAT domain-containing protein